ncbi:MAG TPA: hypothetical protein VKG24_28025 [Pseudolabrys sp.]|nr:hypothetical protein [Pseudolabrys sp.]
MTTAFDFGPMMLARAGRFTVGFVGLENDRAISLGSGTLIQFGKIRGVLTCAHVLAGDVDRQIPGVLDRVEFGICCFPVRTGEVQTLRITRDMTRPVAIGTRPWNQQGPDLAFLRLPDADMTNLERLASVVDGMRQRANAFVGEPDTRHVANLVCGVINERTGPVQMRGNAAAVTTFEGLINSGCVVATSEADGMDLFRFQPVPGEGATLPSTYEGTSGGGLWRLYLKRGEDGTYSLIQSRLVGVAFWETPVEGELHIVCHGQQSLYRALFDRIRAEWPQEFAP